MEPCVNCSTHYESIPACIVTPKDRLGRYGLYHRFCSWNCAKRGLLGLKTKPWFTLLGISALFSGASLPIHASEYGQPPCASHKQIVRHIPPFRNVNLYPVIQIPLLQHEKKTETEEEQPQVYDSVVSITQSTLEMARLSGGM